MFTLNIDKKCAFMDRRCNGSCAACVRVYPAKTVCVDRDMPKRAAIRDGKQYFNNTNDALKYLEKLEERKMIADPEAVYGGVNGEIVGYRIPAVYRCQRMET